MGKLCRVFGVLYTVYIVIALIGKMLWFQVPVICKDSYKLTKDSKRKHPIRYIALIKMHVELLSRCKKPYNNQDKYTKNNWQHNQCVV